MEETSSSSSNHSTVDEEEDSSSRSESSSRPMTTNNSSQATTACSEDGSDTTPTCSPLPSPYDNLTPPEATAVSAYQETQQRKPAPPNQDDIGLVVFDKQGVQTPLPVVGNGPDLSSTCSLSFFASASQNIAAAAAATAFNEDSTSFNPPPKPKDFDDTHGYLETTLHYTERLRLTKCFHLTDGIENDEAFKEQIHHLASFAKLVTGYELAIVGIMSNSHFRRIATDGCPLAIIPRREATCSYTMMRSEQGVEGVFNVPNMKADWRFAKTAHVQLGGLTSYAGVPLLYHIPELNKNIALGSMCVASYNEAPTLTKSQQATLEAIAKSVVNAIISRASALQLNRQTKMQKILNELSPKVDALDPKATLSATLSHLRDVFPGCHITYGHHSNKKIKLVGVKAAVPFSEFNNGMWENNELIDRFIREKNHLEWDADINNEAVRALAANVEDQNYLVVESTDLKKTFSNQAEVMFVQSCALTISNSHHYTRLEEAIQAKATFLRDVQHSIRTNLNGILSASEMLLDEQAQRSSEHWVRQQANLYYSPAHSPPQKEASRPAFNRTISQVSDLTSEYSHTSSSASANSTEGLLTIVDSSGRNLLQVINGLLRLDQTNEQDLKPEKQICNLYDIEEDIIENVMLGTPRAKFFKVTLLTEDNIPLDKANIYTDSKFLIQALSPVVQNAVDFSEEGTVLLTFDLSETGSLVVDVKNDGPSIPKDLQCRIFEPFYKIDSYRSRAGLGLSFAQKYSQALGGFVSVLESTLEHGTTLRLEIPNIFPPPSTHAGLDIARTSNETGRRTPTAVSKEWTYCIEEECLASRNFGAALERLGCRAVALRDANIAVQMEKPRDYHLMKASTMNGSIGSGESISASAAAGIRATTSAGSMANYNSVLTNLDWNAPPRNPEQVVIRLVVAADFRNKSQTYDNTNRVIYCGLPAGQVRAANTLQLAQLLLEENLGTGMETITSAAATTTATDGNGRIASPTTPGLLKTFNELYIDKRGRDLHAFRPKDSLRLLNVDDNTVNLRLIEAFCKKRSYPTVPAIDGNEAVNAFISAHQTGNPITFIVMDLQMPNCSGVEATRRIRAYEHENGMTPSFIYMVTGQSGDKERQESMEAGCDAFWVKPLRIKTLEETLSSHFCL